MSGRFVSSLGSLDDEECADLTAGVGPWRTATIPRLGIPAIKMSDGMVGVRGDRFMGTSSICFPCGPALGSSWDPELVRRLGQALAAEARAKGVAVLLAPVLNLHRHPLAGRNFESFGEDPLHVARMGAAYIEGLQGSGIAAVAKHFVANDAEVDRERVDVRVDEPVLREVYLLPFEVAVREAGVWAVMSAYPKLNGTHCGENEWLLTTVLREEWGFDGPVVSDWGGTHPGSLAAGLDLEMPGPPRLHGRSLLGRFPTGAPELRRAARRMLWLLDRSGTSADPDAAERSVEDPASIAMASEAAERGIVLLTNDGTLPLDGARLSRVAVLGPGAVDTPVQGGGSAFVNPTRQVDIVDGLRASLSPSVEIAHEQGAEASKHAPLLGEGMIATPDGRPGMLVEYLKAATRQVFSRDVLPTSSLLSIGPPVALPMGELTVRASARLRIRRGGPHRLGLMSAGRAVVRLDGDVILDSLDAPAGGEVFFGRGTQEITADVDLAADTEHALTIELEPIVEKSETLGFLLGCWEPTDPGRTERAVEAARGADAAIVVVGTTSEWETEGGDRPSLALPGDQDELVRRVAAANPRTIVVLTCGGPLIMPWIADVSACLVAWFGGQEVGHAVARILLGHAAPSGRLPVTFPADASQIPDLGFDGSTIRYQEGLAVGYRRYERDGLVPAFPFGHGLTYTDFRYGTIVATRDGDVIEVEVPVRNVGHREGAEVVQVYVREIASRDPRRLAGFVRLDVRPGQTETARIRLGVRELRRWRPEAGGWVVPDGPHEVAVGASAGQLHHVAAV